MKKMFVLNLFFLFASGLTVFGQQSIVDGYIVELNGDSLKGKIIEKDPIRTPEMISFQKDSAGFKNYYPKDIRSYGIPGSDIYLSTKVTIDTSRDQTKYLDYNANVQLKDVNVFLKLIYNGRFSLFEYIDESNKTHFFYSMNDSVPTELIYKRYLIKESDRNNNDVVAKLTRYKNQLAYLMKDCPTIEKEVQRLEYTEKGMLKLFRFYGTCTGIVESYSQKVTKPKTLLGIFFGIHNTKLAFTGTSVSNVELASFKSYMGITGGIELIIPIQKKFNRHQVLIDLSYKGLNTSATSVAIVPAIVGNYTINYTYSIENAEVKLNAGYKFIYFRSKTIDLNAFAGLAYSLIISHEYLFTMDAAGPNLTPHSDSGELLEGNEARNNEEFIFGGIGLTYQQKISLNAAYEMGNGFSTISALSSSTKAITLTLGYYF